MVLNSSDRHTQEIQSTQNIILCWQTKCILYEILLHCFVQHNANYIIYGILISTNNFLLILLESLCSLSGYCPCCTTFLSKKLFATLWQKRSHILFLIALDGWNFAMQKTNVCWRLSEIVSIPVFLHSIWKTEQHAMNILVRTMRLKLPNNKWKEEFKTIPQLTCHQVAGRLNTITE